MPQIIPVKELKNTSKISKLCHETEEPIFITKNGYGDMVIMSQKVYEQIMERQNHVPSLEISEEQIKDTQVGGQGDVKHGENGRNWTTKL